MLNDLNPKDYKSIYIVCGFTDIRFGINGLSAIIEQKYKMNVFIGKTLFMFCGHNARLMKALLWEGDGFLLTKRFLLSIKCSLYNSERLLRPFTTHSELYSEYFSFIHIFFLRPQMSILICLTHRHFDEWKHSTKWLKYCFFAIIKMYLNGHLYYDYPQ